MLEGKVRFADSMQDCARESDLLFIATPWDEYKRLAARDLKRGARKPVVVDCWRILPEAEFAAVADLVVLGVGPRG